MNKKRRHQIEIIVFLLIIIIIFLAIFLNLNSFEGFVEKYIERYGFFGILFFSFLAEILEQPIGPEVPASLGVVFGLNVLFVLIFSIIGSYLGSFVSFYGSKKYLSYRLKRGLEIKNYKRYEGLYNKYGKWALFLAAITPVPWVIFCWLSGSFKMKLKQFIAYGLIPRALRIIFVVLIINYFHMSFF